RLGAAVEQRRVGPGCANVKIDLAMIFDVAVDVAAPERVIPAPRIANSEAPAEAGMRKAPTGAVKAAAPAEPWREWLFNVAHLPVIHAVTELHDHVRALGIGRRRISARLQLLRDNARVALELEAAVVGHSAAGNDEEGLSLRRGHRLVARDRGVDALGAGGQRDGGGTDRDRCGQLADTHVT